MKKLEFYLKCKSLNECIEGKNPWVSEILSSYALAYLPNEWSELLHDGRKEQEVALNILRI